VLGPAGTPTLNAANGSMSNCRFTEWDQSGVIANGMPNVTQCNVTGDGSKRYRIEQPVQVIQSADTFKQWYSDSTFSTKVLGTLELTQLAGTNQYQFSSSGGRTVYDDLHDVFLRERGATTGVDSLSSGFFPLEAQTRTKVCNIWPYWKFTSGVACTAGTGLPVPTQWDPQGWYGNNLMPPMMVTGGPVGTVKPITGMMRNFYFTSQVRYLFHYAGGETLSFYGDDDVWVFINGHLVLDLGAPHERLQGSVSLTGPSADYAIQSQDVLTKAITSIAKGTVTGLDLAAGSTYEIAVFHADQHPRESNYELTVSGFSTTRSVCQPKCGDGVATVSEECDDGPQNQDGLYGGCTTECKLGPFCGDGQKNGPEQCDLGRQNGAAYGTKDGCTTACTTPHYCGDRVLDSAFGEQCDEGDANGGSVCTSDCKLVVR
jgi:fibro-slime domain-containing protein